MIPQRSTMTEHNYPKSKDCLCVHLSTMAESEETASLTTDRIYIFKQKHRHKNTVSVMEGNVFPLAGCQRC